jgi:hypothetical protein
MWRRVVSLLVVMAFGVIAPLQTVSAAELVDFGGHLRLPAGASMVDHRVELEGPGGSTSGR